MRRRLLPWLCILLTLSTVSPALAQGSTGQTTIHVVQRGETLFRIALNYGTSVEAIAQTNGISDVTSIQVGQRLVIPSGAVNASVRTAGRHVVQPGETLAHIALRYGTTAEILAALNSVVNPARLYVGQTLDVSETAPGHPPLANGYTVTVGAGDTLYGIALRDGASLNAIMRLNGLKSPAWIFPGERLLIPGPPDAPALQMLPAPLLELKLEPLPIEVGRSFRLRVVSAEPVTITGRFLDRDVVFFPEPDGRTYTAFYGVYAFTPPGVYPLTLTLTNAAGASTPFSAELRVADGGYGNERITVPDSQMALLDPAMNSAEHEVLAGVMSGHTPERYFNGPLGLPAAAPVTSPFGTRRSYNGGPYERFHTGTDFGGGPGAPIYAPAAGRVALVTTLNIYGLFTIIDHGQGVFTAYAHQTESYVEAGQIVQAGEVIGAIGNSGRSVGPHLHWELWVNGVETDAIQWTRFDFAAS